MFLSTATPPDKPPVRIVSLVPSQTELLYYLQLEAETVGITKFCIHPQQWFTSKIRVGGTKTVDVTRVRALNPDLIIANKEENVREQVEMLAQQYPVWLTDVNNLQDAQQMITDIGRCTYRHTQANTLVQLISEKFTNLQKNVEKLSPTFAANSRRLRVCYLIWKDPYITVGSDTFINDMLQKAGFQNAFAHSTRYPTINQEDLRLSACDVVLLSSEPYPFKKKHIQELQEALPSTTIALVDGEMFSWYGSRLLLAADYFQTLHQQIIG